MDLDDLPFRAAPFRRSRECIDQRSKTMWFLDLYSTRVTILNT